jgi:hypothetical protein
MRKIAHGEHRNDRRHAEDFSNVHMRSISLIAFGFLEGAKRTPGQLRRRE